MVSQPTYSYALGCNYPVTVDILNRRYPPQMAGVPIPNYSDSNVSPSTQYSHWINPALVLDPATGCRAYNYPSHMPAYSPSEGFLNYSETPHVSTNHSALTVNQEFMYASPEINPGLQAVPTTHLPISYSHPEPQQQNSGVNRPQYRPLLPAPARAGTTESARSSAGRPFQCDLCRLAYKDHSSRTRHLKDYHGQKSKRAGRESNSSRRVLFVDQTEAFRAKIRAQCPGARIG
ncbi:hypothetical protein BJX64DRAFT_285294 [Aspergillus heterothallicus]